jgi:O-antigen/teichoic acid export membrane protein
MRSLRSRYEQPLETLRGSDTAKAASLAGAMITNNVIALVSTIVFARLLKDSQGGGYGSLADLVSYFLILSVAGQALQVATAREGVLGHLGVGPGLIATLKRWTRSMLAFTAVMTVISILLRNPIARLLNVTDDPWAAAVGIPAGCLWLELSILRGALQGVGDYRSLGISLIGEQGSRLIVGAILAAALAGSGQGVLGAYLGTPFSFIAMCAYCAFYLHRYATRSSVAPSRDEPAPEAALHLWTHVRQAWAPIAGLIIIAVLQNIDIIAAKHRFDTHLATSYAAVAVAAKVLIWVAMGASFYLVPEVSRRRAGGEDTRAVLIRTLGILAVCAIPVFLIFAVGGHQLISAVYGASKATATGALLPLAAAFTVLAATYLAIQYMLALKRTWFLLPLGVIALAEPILLLRAPRHPAGFAAVVLAVQAAGAIVAFTMALRRDRSRPLDGDDEPPADLIEAELVSAARP